MSARRTLEGILKALLENPSGNSLAGWIHQLEKSPALSESLVRLSRLTKEGGNLGAHFDEEVEVDRDLAEHLIDAIDSLLEYFYKLPAAIDRFDLHMQKLKS